MNKKQKTVKVLVSSDGLDQVLIAYKINAITLNEAIIVIRDIFKKQ